MGVTPSYSAVELLPAPDPHHYYEDPGDTPVGPVRGLSAQSEGERKRKGKPSKPSGKGKGKGKPSKPKGKGKGKPSKACPTADELFTMFSDKFEGSICLLTEMGWITVNGSSVMFDNVTFAADISTLPTEVAANLTDTKFDMCVDKIVGMSMGYFTKCMDSYTSSEQDIITDLLNGVANLKCFLYSLGTACNVYVSDYVRTTLGLPT